jgi:colanic acid biosynthesis glycosyl transferase WcaI
MNTPAADKPVPTWVVSELYFPEQSATGYYLTRIAEALAQSGDVRVISGQPTYAARGIRAPRTELRNGVAIFRCRATTFAKDQLLGRVINLATFTIAAFITGVLQFRRGDNVIAVTNPPTIPFVIALACALRGAHCYILVHDVYPDAMIAAGMLVERSFAAKMLRSLHRWLYRAVAHVIVLGRDMSTLIQRRAGTGACAITIIPNWADTDVIAPSSRADNTLLTQHRLDDKFVIQYSGNMGRTHGIECILNAAVKLSSSDRIHFLFIGSGAKREWLECEAGRLRVSNCTVLPPQRREDLTVSLNACDIAIIAFVPGMSGVSVPSRMYNVMAAGRPIIAVADEDSELALVVKEERIGWVVLPDHVDDLVAAILQAAGDPEMLAGMGARARQAAEEKYSYKHVAAMYARLIPGRDHMRRI